MQPVAPVATRTAPAEHVHPSAGRVFGAELARRLVQIEKTPLTQAQAGSALASAWERHYGKAPSQSTLSLLVAQWAHETGWGQSMLNNNFGGIKGTSPEGLSVACRTREGHDESLRTIVDSFRAYSTPEAGAYDYVGLLKGRYGAALERAEAGDVKGFVRALKDRGYFTDSLENYTRAIEGILGRVEPDAVRQVSANDGAFYEALAMANAIEGASQQRARRRDEAEMG